MKCATLWIAASTALACTFPDYEVLDMGPGANGGASFGGSGGGSAGTGPMKALQSVDLQGDCRGGIPTQQGTTTVIAELAAYDIIAFGSEIGHDCSQDQGRLAYLEFEGDFDVVVQITSMDNFGAPQGDFGNPVKAGLMLRETLDPAARYVAMFAVQPNSMYPDSFHFDYRRKQGARLKSDGGGFDYGWLNRDHPIHSRQFPDIWVRLERESNVIRGYASEDGQNWVSPSIASYETDFGRTVYLGLAASSGVNGSFDQESLSKFRNLRGLAEASMLQ